MEQKHICLNQECPYWDVATYRQCDKEIDIYDCHGARLVLPEKTRAKTLEPPAIPQQVNGAIALLAKQIDSHWREFGPEYGFGELMDRLYAVLEQLHH